LKHSVFQLYESALSENQKLKSKLQEAQLELADIKSKLEKAAQVRPKAAPLLGKASTAPCQANTSAVWEGMQCSGGKLLQGRLMLHCTE